MAYRHFLRLRRRVWIGGPGPLLRGAYTVGPLSVLQCLGALPVVAQFAHRLMAGADEVMAHVSAVGPQAFAPLVVALVEEPVRRRHIRNLTAGQAAAVIAATAECNDWEYLVAKLLPEGKEKQQQDRVGVEVMVVWLAKELGIDPRSLLTRPLQEVLAYVDALKELAPEQEQAAPLDDDDRALLAAAGMVP